MFLIMLMKCQGKILHMHKRVVVELSRGNSLGVLTASHKTRIKQMVFSCDRAITDKFVEIINTLTY